MIEISSCNFKSVPMKRLLAFGFFLSLALVLFSCQKELSQESNLNNASFSLHDDSTKACYDITVNGTYYNGVSAAQDTNFITVTVNVKSTGNYNITTDSLHGFYFSASGFFSKTGFDTLILKAKGTPILPQLTDFVIAVDSLGNCGFTVDVQDSTGTGLGNDGNTGGGEPEIDTSYVDANPANDSTWHFTDSISGLSYSGKLPAGLTTIQDDNGTMYLELSGFSDDLTQFFGFDIDLPAAGITPGVYPISDNENNFLALTNISSEDDVYYSDNVVAAAGTSYSYITITGYDAATKHITGSFHCWATDADNNPALLKGSFNAYLP